MATKRSVRSLAPLPKALKSEVFTHVMVDLETLGNRPGCKILSIGAVAFGPEGLGEEFYVVVDRESQTDFGLHEDASTIEWWDKQTVEAKSVLIEAEDGEPLSRCLLNFNAYLARFGMSDIKLWGNGSDFDNAILISCYAATKQQAGWKFWNNRCYRTLKSLHPGVKLNRTGTYHNALDDAKTQALHAIPMLWPNAT
jgi:exodeoxyribonuclease VIII